MRSVLVALGIAAYLLRTAPFPMQDSAWLALTVYPFSTEAGCEMDPSGRCLAGLMQQPHSEAGCEMDPDGRCRTGS